MLAGTAVTFAGCGGLKGAIGPQGTATGTPSPSALPLSEGPQDVELPVSRGELRRGAPRDVIAAITEPAFAADWGDVAINLSEGETGETATYRPRLTSENRVLGVERDGKARAYPLKVLNWHEVVNDEFGAALLVTYCPLCRSGVVARRVVNGTSTLFGVSGLLWHENLVLYDRATESLWSQILMTAIQGPETSNSLELVPSTLTSWSTWREQHPNTDVLLPPPLSDTVLGEMRINYSFDLHERWNELQEKAIKSDDHGDTRLPKRALVLGVVADGTTRAYPLMVLTYESVVNDRVGDLPVVVAAGPDDSMAAYDRRVAGDVLRFEPADAAHMRGGGSRWERVTGRAVSGPHEDTRLQRVGVNTPMFWFAWLNFHPDTTVYGRDV